MIDLENNRREAKMERDIYESHPHEILQFIVEKLGQQHAVAEYIAGLKKERDGEPARFSDNRD